MNKITKKKTCYYQCISTDFNKIDENKYIDKFIKIFKKLS